MATPSDPFPGAAPAPPASETAILANWSQRGFAYLVDILAILILTSLAETFAGAFYADTSVLLVLLSVTITFVYFLTFSLAGGRSPGKRVFRLRTATLDGGTPSVVQSVLDAASKVQPILLADFLAGLVVGRARRQRLSQKAGGSVVLFEPPPAPKRVVFVP